jgi:hypothetical protein
MAVAEALEAWLADACDKIIKRFDDFVQLIGMSGWYELPSGGFKKYPARAMYKIKALEDLLFVDNKRWDIVEKTSKELESLWKHVGVFIHYDSGSGKSLKLNEFCRQLLPELRITEDGRISAEFTFDVKQKVSEFLDYFDRDYIDRTIIYPVRGVSCDEGIKLDTATEIRRLSASEKIACLNLGIIRTTFDDEVEPVYSNWYGLCRTFRDKKHFGYHNRPDRDILAIYLDREQTLEDFLVSVFIVTNRLAFHAGGISSAPHFEIGGYLLPGVYGHGIDGSNDIMFMFVDEESKLDAEKTENIKSVWNIVRSNSADKYRKRVVNAARRMFYAETRSRQSDAIIDLMVAAESLYLNDEKNELKYRLSINAAIWTGLDREIQSETFSVFKKAYDVRSKVVHGSFASMEQISSSINSVKPIIRAGIIRAFEDIAQKRAPPDWDKLLFSFAGKIAAAEEEAR